MIRRLVPFGVVALALLSGVSCAYLNTFYNAQQAFKDGERLSAGKADSVPSPAAKAAYEKSAEKSAIVLRRYGDSGYADDALLLMGRSFVRLGRHGDAAVAFEKLLARFPDSEFAPRARLELARSRRIVGDPLAARATLAPLVDGAPGDLEAEVLHERALIAVAAGEHEEAVRRFEALLERDPGYARRGDTMLRFADILYGAGRVEDALDTYARHRELADDPRVRRRAGMRIAEAMAGQGRTEEASEVYATLLEESPSDSISAAVHLARGLVAEAGGRFEDAVADYRKVKGLWPGSELASRAALHEGQIAWQVEKRREESLHIFLDAFLHAPLSAYADTSRTMARGVAEVIHLRSLARGPGELEPGLSATAEYRLAEEILLQEEDPAAAVEAYERVVDAYPDSPWAPRAMLAIGVLEGRLGRVEEGRRWLEELIQHHPDSPEADSARLQLGRLVPERDAGFYADAGELVRLGGALPPAEDPMRLVVNELDRYAGRRSAAVVQRGPTADRATPADSIPNEPVRMGPARPGVRVGVE